jgi:hypothetical protein
MTPVSRLEKWIAPRAALLLAVISALVLAGGVAAYFIVAHNFERVDRLERVIQCQHNVECREFVERAIREILKDRQRKDQNGDHRGVTFRLGGTPNRLQVSPSFGIASEPSPEELPSGGQETAQSPSKPNLPQGGGNHPEGGKTGKTPRPGEAPHEGSSAPEGREQKSAPITPERIETTPAPVPPETAHVEPTLPTPAEAVEQVEGIICSAIREVHELC